MQRFRSLPRIFCRGDICGDRGIQKHRMLAPGESYSETLPAVANAVPTARAAITEFAREAGAKGDRLQAIRLATSEAVTNAVLHAYDGISGLIQVTASYVPGELWVLVADSGCGLHPRRDSPGLGVGLALKKIRGHGEVE